MSNKRKSMKRRRKILYNEQGGRCIYCDKEMWLRSENMSGKRHLEATLEHIKPLSQGGSHMQRTNQAVSCITCNGLRGIIPHNVFIELHKETNWESIAKEERWFGLNGNFKKQYQALERRRARLKKSTLYYKISTYIRNKYKKYLPIH